MTSEEFLAIAKRKGWVRWEKSGIPERLIHINNERPHIIAEGPVTVPHVIRPRAGDIACVEINPAWLISFGELLELHRTAPIQLRRPWPAKRRSQ